MPLPVKKSSLSARFTQTHETIMKTLRKRWDRYTVNISPRGEVTLRTPSGRTTAWHGRTDTPSAAAAEWLETFPGAALVDRREVMTSAR